MVVYENSEGLHSVATVMMLAKLMLTVRTGAANLQCHLRYTETGFCVQWHSDLLTSDLTVSLYNHDVPVHPSAPPLPIRRRHCPGHCCPTVWEDQQHSPLCHLHKQQDYYRYRGATKTSRDPWGFTRLEVNTKQQKYARVSVKCSICRDLPRERGHRCLNLDNNSWMKDMRETDGIKAAG